MKLILDWRFERGMDIASPSVPGKKNQRMSDGLVAAFSFLSRPFALFQLVVHIYILFACVFVCFFVFFCGRLTG